MNLADVDPKYTAMCSDRTLQEEEKGFFNKLVEACIENTKIEDSALTMWSKNIYGIEFVKELLKDGEILNKISDVFCVEPVFRKKNIDTSNKAKNLAINELKDKNYQKALSLLNQAVIFLPTDLPNADSHLGLLLWFRSECLLKLDKYDLALSDLQVAMKIPSILENRGPFFYRQGECYKKIGEIQKAKISYNLALKFLNEKSPLYETAKSEINILNQEKITNGIKPNIDHSKIDDDGNKQDLSKEFLSIAEEDGMGRFLIAKKDIAVGENILIEEPYAACLKFNSYGTHCYHCFERLQISYGCPKCANLAFCSLKCRDSALETYHKYECSFMDLFIGSGMSILCIIALRMVTQLGLQKALDTYEKYLSENKNCNKNSLNDKESLIYNLCTHVDLRDPLDHLKRFFMSFFIFRCLQKSNFFSNQTSENKLTLNEDETKILSLLLHNIQMLQFNAHEIEELIPPEMRKNGKISTRTIGVGIYPKASLLNHDCYQGVARYFIGKKIVMRTIRPVPMDTMIPENYGPVFTKRTKYARQRVLRSRYWFKCNCMSCTEIWPDLDQLPQKNLPMFHCDNAKCIGKINLDNADACVECGNVLTSDDIQKKKIVFEESCMKKYEEGSSFMNANKYDEAINVLTEALDVFHKTAYPPHYETHQAEQNLRMCFITLKCTH